MFKVCGIWDLGIYSVQCEKDIKGLHGNKGRQHYGGKCEGGRMSPQSGCVMGGQQDVTGC